MFDISFFEIMIISIIALIVVGPERLPQVARTLGHLMGRCRQIIYSVRTDIHNEIRMEELKNMHNTVQESVQMIEDSVRKEISELKSTANIESQDKTAVTNTDGTTGTKLESNSLSQTRTAQFTPADKDNKSSSP